MKHIDQGANLIDITAAEFVIVGQGGWDVSDSETLNPFGQQIFDHQDHTYVTEINFDDLHTFLDNNI